MHDASPVTTTETFRRKPPELQNFRSREFLHNLSPAADLLLDGLDDLAASPIHRSLDHRRSVFDHDGLHGVENGGYWNLHFFIEQKFYLANPSLNACAHNAYAYPRAGVMRPRVAAVGRGDGMGEAVGWLTIKRKLIDE